MVTASIASFLLGLVMVLVIIVSRSLLPTMLTLYILLPHLYNQNRPNGFVIVASRRFNVNPDNVATPIAASLGDD